MLTSAEFYTASSQCFVDFSKNILLFRYTKQTTENLFTSYVLVFNLKLCDFDRVFSP